ncbi:MAG: hypothetical protein A2945_02055 [Candidatus Liptonbacteria bacterium RIFCSPLOWO2_01_FULL_52_25]|uniref:CAAX prenyl protease 2/Lysostaphin resistance protein A-like domain-containing protein n=1 Tax=Candidatus Liptonbacteria bacterium RIFCSPLOWO2_01_FULL_52_25 TaxID=1798650 RepID=A0A1G2CG94_9BACT|nr:MAG: hypothetical protein A2945_02055 [Candidatus Liptonbacteria bacterium RIFCSPLOWO2_01_FULL_52_25]
MKKWLGFEKWFDFPHEHTPAGRFMKVMAVLMLLLLYTIAVSAVLLLTGRSRNELATLLHPLALTANILGSPASTFDIVGGSVGQLVTKGMLFFHACVLAPLWEEIVFRMLPIGLVIFLAGYLEQILVMLARIFAIFQEKTGPVLTDAATRQPPNFLVVVCLASSIIFGIGHGSIMNLLFQGVTGGAFCWLYYKTNYSYLSIISAHAIWNFLVIFGIRVLFLFP